MPYRIETGGENLKKARLLEQRVRNIRPVAAKVGEYLAREARRRAPRGQSRRMQGLAASLNHVEPAHNVTVLVSDKAYAAMQQYGGTIVAGTGRLAAKALAIPVNDAARRAMETIGAGTSLRALNLTLIVTPKGAFLVGDVAGVGKIKRRKGEAAMRQPGYAVFVLKRSVRLNPNPAPHGYAPRLSEPAVASFVAGTLRRYLHTGQA